MAKTADVRLFWTRSPSSDAVKQKVTIVNDGTESTVELDMVAQEVTVSCKASSSCRFKVQTFDSEGNTSTSEEYAFTLGDLDNPLPATGLGHEVLAVHDDSTTPTPTPTPSGTTRRQGGKGE